MTIVKLYSCLTSWWWLSFTPQERTHRWETWILGTTFTPAHLIRNQLSDFHPRLKVAERMLLEQRITASNFFYSFFVYVSDSSSKASICTVQSELFLKLHSCKSYSEVECSLHVFVPQSVVIDHPLIISKSEKKNVLKANYIPKCQSLFFRPWSSHMRTPHNGGTIWWHTRDYTHRVAIKSAQFVSGRPAWVKHVGYLTPIGLLHILQLPALVFCQGSGA